MTHGIRKWLRQLRRWVDRLFGQRATSRGGSRILATRESDWIRLLLLDTDYEDDQIVRVRSWRCVLRSTESKHDLLVTCDRLKSHGRSESQRFATTHRFAVLRISRTPINGKTRSDCLLIADLDCVGFQMNRGLDGFAPQIADSLAVQLTKRTPQELSMLIDLEDGSGLEIPGERLRVQAKWLSIVKAYHIEYFPIIGSSY